MKRKNPRLFNVYSTDFRVSITPRGLKVNHLNPENKKRAIGPAVWGTFEEVTGRSGHDCEYDMSPAQISAFIRRKIFNKKVDIPKFDYIYDIWGYPHDPDTMKAIY